MNAIDTSKAPDLAIAASRRPDRATPRWSGQGAAPDLVGAVEPDLPHPLGWPAEAQLVEDHVVNELSAVGFVVTKVTTHPGGAGTSRYLTAERIIREQITVRISNHRTSRGQERGRFFSLVWSKPARLARFVQWLRDGASTFMVTHRFDELGLPRFRYQTATATAQQSIGAGPDGPPSVQRGTK